MGESKWKGMRKRDRERKGKDKRESNGGKLMEI